MRLEALQIRHFRGAKDTALTDCGTFNVLIGKNNAGKSTLLSAVHAFYAAMEPGVVNLKPPVGLETDFFDSDPRHPISVTGDLTLSEVDHDWLTQAIVEYAPGLTNAVEVLSGAHLLSVVLEVRRDHQPYSIVTNMILRQDDRVHQLFSVDADARRALVRRERALDATRREKDSASSIARDMTPDQWERVRQYSRDRSIPEAFVLREFAQRDLHPETRRVLQDVFARSESYREARIALEDYAESVTGRLERQLAEPIEPSVRSFGGEETRVPAYCEELVRRIGSTRVLYLRDRREPIGRAEADELLRLKVRRGGTDRLRSIQTTVSDLLGVRIDAFEGTGAVRAGSGRPAELDVDDFVVQVNGSGIREALRIILDFEFKNPSILIVEEPEIYLHPALEISLMRYLRQAGSSCQVFISTHSTNFIDTADMAGVYLVSRETATQVQHLDVGEVEERIPRELGLRLSSVFMFDRLVFVEGPTDEEILRELAFTVGVNLGQANVGFVHLGGVRNFVHFATKATLEFLTHRNVQMTFILDHDEKDDDEVASLEALVGENATLHVLRRRELENYLLSPRAVASWLESLDVGAVDEDEVARRLDQAADELRALTLHKRAAYALLRPVRPALSSLDLGGDIDIVATIADEIRRVQGALEELCSSVESKTASIKASMSAGWEQEKLNMVSGSRLLDLVAARYGRRFRKGRSDGAAVARLLCDDDIAPELKQLLALIAT